MRTFASIFRWQASLRRRGDGSWLCENSSARRARRNISKKLRTMESNRAACTMFDTLLANCIFYISQLYEFSHRLDQRRYGYVRRMVAGCKKETTPRRGDRFAGRSAGGDLGGT